MTSQGDREQLEYITRALTRLTALGADGREAFLDDWVRQSAALYELQTLAEATQRLSEDLRARHPELPWRDIAAFRNRIVHG
ncbi:MAG: HepT-like ribonuclease domain-containing protein, partial [Candidatus Dormibacteria bacterium]